MPAVRGLVPAGGGALPTGALPQAGEALALTRGLAASFCGRSATARQRPGLPRHRREALQAAAAALGAAVRLHLGTSGSRPRGRRALPRAGGCLRDLGQPAAAAATSQPRRAAAAAPAAWPPYPGARPPGVLPAAGGIAAARWHSSRTCSAWRGVWRPATAPARPRRPHRPGTRSAAPAALAPPLPSGAGPPATAAPATLGPPPTCWSAARCPACCCFCSCSRRPASSCRSIRTPWRSTPGRLSTATGRTAAARCPELFLLLQSLVMATPRGRTRRPSSCCR